MPLQALAEAAHLLGLAEAMCPQVLAEAVHLRGLAEAVRLQALAEVLGEAPG